MKYVKLFENWLNEAEGGGKPFDPNKPSETLVVDITRKDVSDDPVRQAKVLSSIFNRMIAKKDAPDVEETIKLTPFKVTGYKGVPGSQITLRGEGKTYTYKVPNSSDTLSVLNDKYLFFVTPKDYTFPENEKQPSIDARNRIIVLAPRGNSGLDGPISLKDDKFIGDGLSLGLVFEVFVKGFDTGKSYKSEFNELCNDFSTKWKTSGWSGTGNGTSQSYQDIAKNLGYEIPDNYTPGQGVEKTKA